MVTMEKPSPLSLDTVGIDEGEKMVSCAMAIRLFIKLTDYCKKNNLSKKHVIHQALWSYFHKVGEM